MRRSLLIGFLIGCTIAGGIAWKMHRDQRSANTVELCFTDVPSTIQSMSIYALDESNADDTHWFGGKLGEVGKLSGNSCLTYTSRWPVSESDVRVNGTQNGTYLVYGSTPSHAQAHMTANGHPCTVLSNGAGGGDYVCGPATGN